jgi:hypothetical protein
MVQKSLRVTETARELRSSAWPDVGEAPKAFFPNSALCSMSLSGAEDPSATKPMPHSRTPTHFVVHRGKLDGTLGSPALELYSHNLLHKTNNASITTWPKLQHMMPKLLTIASESHHYFTSEHHCTTALATSSTNFIYCFIPECATFSSSKCINGFVEPFVSVGIQYLVVSLTFGYNWDHQLIFLTNFIDSDF